ncbi:right-handed parallel beta-helix repeat-containing protein [Halorubrum sp. AD140]|uniref:right-handed parallel beta-helix repeat-containing protein n=1 Tax=Halorubrum sp. AD140 TaxID=3050073 RepID=UPI002ACCB18B|nr:right-handed parallel beta-helix repeat-containing protein [Halorubrum sp. AD140]MDZ5810217.1 right-handed parallel beta-helix repeat-containing protein [Halorubrum sp. AD140]
MANSHDDDDTNRLGFGRRSYLGIVGTAVGMVGLTGGAAAQSAEDVVDLGEKGLSEGDVIDDYLEEYFESGVEVRVPAGEYEYHGSGFGGSRSDAAVVGQGEVVLTNEVGAYQEDIEATDGVVAVRNITLRGKSGPEKTRFRLEAEEGGRVVVDNLNLPDGNVEEGDARGFYVPRGHAGVVEIRNCYIANNSNNGIYASSPGKEGKGQVIVENCFLHNNNITGIRLGSSKSAARNCLILNDGKPPVRPSSSLNMRGIRIREPGEDMVIEDCEIIHSYEDAGGPIELHDGAEGGTGTIRNVKIRNETDTEAINGKGDTADGWSAENVSITGDGNVEYPSNFDDVCVGDECASPDDEDPRNVDTDESDGDDDSSDDEPSLGTDGTELTIAADNSDGVDYEFTTTGEIEPLYERDEYNANLVEPVDEAVENDDGTWTATGSNGGGSTSGDSYRYEGAMTEFSADGDVDEMVLIADGQEVTEEDLLEVEPDDDSGDEEAEDDSDATAETDDGTDDGTDDDESWKTVVFDGTEADTVTAYSFRVTGEVVRDDAISTDPDGNMWDELDDTVDDDSVTGALGKGIDGYRYTGNLVDIDFDGAAAVTIDDY